MIYELRIYHAMPGRLPALLLRFQNHTLRIWEKHRIRQTGFWTTLIGESNQRLIYMLAWESMADREERWGAFLSDPEWIAIGTETEKDGQLVQNISSELLAPTAFSSQTRDMDVATLANLLRETAEHHDRYEKTHAEHHWWDWYAPYLSARQNGSSSEESAVAADHYSAARL